MPPEDPAEYASPKPQFALDPDLLRKNVPETLCAPPQWVAWRYVMRNGSWTRCSISPTKGGHASSTDPATWGPFVQAISACQSCNDLAGIGFVLTDGDPFLGVDLDDCCTSASVLDTDTCELIKPLRTYCEWSPSGRGIHLIAEGEKPGPLCRKGNSEGYDRARFFCMRRP
jgi:primase-polymerase (primpol)-like protein